MKNKSTLLKRAAKCILLATCAALSTPELRAQNIVTAVGGGSLGSGYSGDGGAATNAQISEAFGIAFDRSGNLFIADADNGVVRKVNVAGIITTIAGNGAFDSYGDGGAATDAALAFPSGVAVDAAGNVYIADTYNSKIRKVTPAGVISTFAGIGSFSYSGDGGQASDAELYLPQSVAVDAGGNVYVADAANYCIRKIDNSGIIHTFAGVGAAGSSGDGGQATDAQINYVYNITLDNSGNLFIADPGSANVRKVTPAGIISTVAGNGSAAYSGDGGQATDAEVGTPYGVAVDTIGNIFITDFTNYIVRKINTSGIISTYGGDGSGSYSGDGGPAVDAEIGGPIAIAADRRGNVVFSDLSYYAIRKITPYHAPYFVAGTTQSVSLCVNTTSNLNAALRIFDLDARHTLNWSVVSGAGHGTVSAAYTGTSTGSVVYPAGLTYTPAGGYVGSDVFTVQVTDGTDTAITIVNITVSPLPSVPAISGTSVICIGGSTALTGTPSGGVWRSNGSSSLTFTSAGVVTGVSGSTAGYMYYRVSNAIGCHSEAGINVVVNTPGSIPAFTSAAGSVCPGSSFTMTHPTSGGIWSSSNPSIATVAGGVVTGVASGRDTILYTATYGCGAVTARWPFTVTGPTNVAVINGNPSPMCTGASFTLTDPTIGGVWSSTNPSLVTISASGVITAVSSGTDTIRYSVTNTCGQTSYAQKPVTVRAAPNAGTITGLSTVAAGATITLSTTGTGGFWSSSNNTLATVNSGGIVRGVSTGTDTIRYTVTTPCATAVAYKEVSVTGHRSENNNGNTITESVEAGSIQIYPNPTTGFVTIEIKGAAGSSSVMVTDISGRVVANTTTEEQKFNLDMSNFAQGVYMLKIITGERTYNEKVIVQ